MAKKYIGQSLNIYERWCKHKSELKSNTHHNDYLQKSYNKYGLNVFNFYILETCDENRLNDLERYYIELYNTTNRTFGYNLKTGGQDINSMSDYVKKKISISNKKAYENYELRQKRSEDAKKQWSNMEIRDKIIGKNNGMYGKHHSDETKKKISDMKKGLISPKRDTRRIYCLELDNVFECTTDAANELHLNSSTILQVCYGNRKTHGGYHWKFI